MTHYFTKNSHLDSEEKDIYFKIRDTRYHFITDNGVFSKSHLDFGSRQLIESVIDVKKKRILDLGCGYGPIGIIYKRCQPDADMTMVDINDRAVELTRKNARLNDVDVDVQISDGFDSLSGTFDLILSNPPIRSGKERLYQMLEKAADFLETDGWLVFVIHKQLGGTSALRFCDEIYRKVDMIHKKSGYLIIRCIK